MKKKVHVNLNTKKVTIPVEILWEISNDNPLELLEYDDWDNETIKTSIEVNNNTLDIDIYCSYIQKVEEEGYDYDLPTEYIVTEYDLHVNKVMLEYITDNNIYRDLELDDNTLENLQRILKEDNKPGFY